LLGARVTLLLLCEHAYGRFLQHSASGSKFANSFLTSKQGSRFKPVNQQSAFKVFALKFDCPKSLAGARFLLGTKFLTDRTIRHAFGTMCRLSVCLSVVCLSSVASVVCDVLYCGETVRPSKKLFEGVNRKPGSKG